MPIRIRPPTPSQIENMPATIIGRPMREALTRRPRRSVALCRSRTAALTSAVSAVRPVKIRPAVPVAPVPKAATTPITTMPAIRIEALSAQAVRLRSPRIRYQVEAVFWITVANSTEAVSTVAAPVPASQSRPMSRSNARDETKVSHQSRSPTALSRLIR